MTEMPKSLKKTSMPVDVLYFTSSDAAPPQMLFGGKTKSSSIADLRLKAKRHQEAILKGVFLSGDDDLD